MKALKNVAIVFAIAVLFCQFSSNELFAKQYQQYQQVPQQPYRQLGNQQTYGTPIQQWPRTSPGAVNPYTQPAGNGIHTQMHWSSRLQPSNRYHDFGAVPSFSKQEFVFEFENVLDETIFLTDVRTSCGCTKPKILTPEVKPGEVAQVLAVFDTKGHKGDRRANVSITLRRDKPYTEFGEVQVEVKGSIRRDVVLQPGDVEFGDLTPGESAVRTVKILYAGSPIWKIVDIRSTNPNLTVEKRELQRDPVTKRVDYELTLLLSGQQGLGTFYDQLTILTNDRTNQQMTVNVEGNVHPVVEVSPVRLGVVTRGTEIKKRLILHGSRPFGITAVKVGDQRIKVDSSEGSKTLHILNYTLDTSVAGQLNSEVTIETDDPGQKQAVVSFEAQIVPETFAVDR